MSPAPFVHDCADQVLPTGRCQECGVWTYACICGQDVTEHEQLGHLEEVR